MANRPTFKQQNSFVGGSEGPAYEMKPIGSAVFEEILEEPGSDTEGLETEKKGTRGDQKDMHRMNKVGRLLESWFSTAIDSTGRSKNFVATSASCQYSATV